tara:strand:- start:294 stop:461 length:168 start_codon:yes stop_codon:yes gene_type:complete
MPVIKLPENVSYQDIIKNSQENEIELLDTELDRALLDNDTDKVKQLVQTKDLYQN